MTASPPLSRGLRSVRWAENERPSQTTWTMNSAGPAWPTPVGRGYPLGRSSGPCRGASPTGSGSCRAVRRGDSRDRRGHAHLEAKLLVALRGRGTDDVHEARGTVPGISRWVRHPRWTCFLRTGRLCQQNVAMSANRALRTAARLPMAHPHPCRLMSLGNATDATGRGRAERRDRALRVNGDIPSPKPVRLGDTLNRPVRSARDLAA
jgi:hypothetical protein